MLKCNEERLKQIETRAAETLFIPPQGRTILARTLDDARELRDLVADVRALTRELAAAKDGPAILEALRGRGAAALKLPDGQLTAELMERLAGVRADAVHGFNGLETGLLRLLGYAAGKWGFDLAQEAEEMLALSGPEGDPEVVATSVSDATKPVGDEGMLAATARRDLGEDSPW
jgi:hypothetical protein